MVDATKIKNKGFPLPKEVKERNEEIAVSGTVGSAGSGVPVL